MHMAAAVGNTQLGSMRERADWKMESGAGDLARGGVRLGRMPRGGVRMGRISVYNSTCVNSVFLYTVCHQCVDFCMRLCVEKSMHTFYGKQ